MKKKNQRMKKWMQAMAACLAVLLLGGGVLVQQAHAVTSVVSLDVNPSIELRVNSREKVVSCQALNDEAAAVLADMDGGRDLKGVKADVAVNAIVGSLVRCGYLDTLSSAILISVEDKDQARAQRLQQELTSVAGGALGDSQAAVLSQTVQQDKDLEKLARSIVDTLGGEFYTKAQVGIGSVIAGIKDLARSFREAQAALEVGKVFDTERLIVSYDNLGIARIIYQLPTTLCEQYLREVFKKGSIESLDHETLFTIQKFFENNLNVSETSRKLFVHRNTLVYRLEKIKKLTGLDLREFDHAIIFKVALMVKKYLTANPVKY